MPMYDYVCKNCKEKFSKNVPMKDYKKPQKCPSCKSLCEKKVSCAALKDVH